MRRKKENIFVAETLLLIFCLVVGLQKFSQAEPCSILLSRIAFKSDHLRTDQDLQFWNLYKNDSKFSSWVDSLQEVSDPETLVQKYSAISTGPKNARPRHFDFDKNVVLDSDGKEIQINLKEIELPELSRPLTSYEWFVLHLRKGDRITIDGDEFTLGDFLGAGNAKHVFALRDFPDRAIGIAFVPNISADRFKDQKTFKEIGRMRMERFIQKRKRMPSTAKAVKIFSWSPHFDYVVMERVFGKLNGRDFLEGQIKAEMNGITADRKRFMESQLYEAFLSTGPESYFPVKLIVEWGLSPERQKAHTSFARQFIWQEGEILDWIAVDWE